MQQFKSLQTGLSLIQIMLIIAVLGVAATAGIRMWMTNEESQEPVTPVAEEAAQPGTDQQ